MGKPKKQRPNNRPVSPPKTSTKRGILSLFLGQDKADAKLQYDRHHGKVRGHGGA